MGLITAHLRFDYQGHVGWWAGQELAVLVPGADGGQVLLQRDAVAERHAVERLQGLGLLATDDGLFGIPGERAQDDWMHWADNGFAGLRDAGFDVTLDAALHGWVQHADRLDVVLQPEGDDATTSPWFALSLGMEINGVRHNILPWLPDLIAAAAAQPLDPATGLPQLPGHVYMPSLTGAGFVRLPTDTLRPWMAALLDLAGDRARDFNADRLKLSRLDALRASAALGEGAVWQGAGALRDMLAQLRGASTLPEVPLPASVRATLRPYQQQGLNWLQFLRAHGLAGVLADDMGLGKTLQTLAHIQVEKDAGRLTCPALVIAPVSLMGNWQREAARFAQACGAWCCMARIAMKRPMKSPSTTWSSRRIRCCNATETAGWGTSGTWWCWTRPRTSRTPAARPHRWSANCRRATGCACRVRPWKTTWARSGACSTS